MVATIWLRGRDSRAGHYLLLLALGLVLFMNNLGGPSLWDRDEGRNATASLEMLASGDFVVPTFNGQLRVDKPVLLYWVQSASIQAFGINEFAVRFPSALAALGTLLCCYELGRALFRPSTALLGGLILGSTAMMAGAGRFANPDAILNLIIAMLLTFFWRGQTRPRSSWFIGMGILLGLAALTKGPVGVFLPGLAIVTFLAWEKRLAVLWNRRAWYVILFLALVAMPWYIWVSALTRGAFLQGFLWEHNFSRFLHPINDHAGSPFYYILVLLVGMAPWSIFIFFAAWYGAWSMVHMPWSRGAAWWRRASEGAAGSGVRGQGSEVRSHSPVPGPLPPASCLLTNPASSARAYRFLGAWLSCYLIFFSVAATKLPNYLLPAMVPCALLTARFLDRWRLREIQPPHWVILTCLASMALVGIATGLGLACVSGTLPLGTFAGPFVSGLEGWGLFGLVPVAASLVGLWSLRRHRPNGVVLSFVVGIISFLGPLTAWALPAWNQIKAPCPLAQKTPALARDQDIRIGGFHLEHLPSLNFYMQREVLHHGNEAEALAFLHYQVPVYLFLPARLWNGLKERAPPTAQVIAHHPDLYRLGDVVVVTNQPGAQR